MNILAFILAILLILSYSTFAQFQKHLSSRRSQTAYIGLRKAERSLLRQSEAKTFRDTPGTIIKPLKHKAATPKEKKAARYPAINPPCCRLNLFPLLIDGKENHPARYELAAKLLRTFYPAEFKKKGFEYHLLDSLIESGKLALKEQDTLPLETISLNDPELQPLYYQLLKGTKHADLFTAKGAPPLIDYFKIDRAVEPICLFHAHPHMLTPFFGVKPTPALYQKLHQEVKSGIELEALLFLANNPQLSLIDPAIWELLDLKRPSHGRPSQETLIAEDKTTGISIRKNITKS